MHSVYARMINEMKAGMGSLATSGGGDVVNEVIYANRGGPYGSEVLQSVQEDSDRVWEEEVLNFGEEEEGGGARGQ